MRIVLAYQNTKKKNLDFAITPYLFFVDSQQCRKTKEPEYAGHGIGLSGMPRLRANLRCKRGEFKQLYSRVGFCYDLGKTPTDEDMAILAESAMGTGEHNNTLLKVAEGNARRLAKLIKGVGRYADVQWRANLYRDDRAVCY